MKFVSCVKWIQKGVAKSHPDRIELTRGELMVLAKGNQEETSNLPDDNEDADELECSDNNDNISFNSYDDDNDENGQMTAKLLGLGSLAVYTDDGFVNLPSMDEPDSDDEDENIKPDDNLIVVGSSEKDLDVLKVFVFNETSGDFYLHHDIMINSCPLCLEWIRHSNNEDSNIIVVGTMDPIIELWDLDVINALEPIDRLGYKAQEKKHSHRNIGHKKAVLSLSWNKNLDHILASGSADNTVCLWDLDTGKPNTKLTNFKGEIENLEWHPYEGQTLLVGCADSTVKMFDCRYDNTFLKWKVDGEASVVKWNPWNPFSCFIGTSTGHLLLFDVRKKKKPVWDIMAHDTDITGVQTAECYEGMLITSSQESTVKVWDLNHKLPRNIATQEADVGKLVSFELNPDVPYIGCVGGSEKNKTFKILRFNKLPAVAKKWNINSKYDSNSKERESEDTAADSTDEEMDN